MGLQRNGWEEYAENLASPASDEPRFFLKTSRQLGIIGRVSLPSKPKSVLTVDISFSESAFMSVILTENLCKSYGDRRGVDDVCLSIQGGEIFGFLGPNGAGKSTTIRLLLGFLKASSGVASIFGKDCWKQSDSIKQDVGYVAGDVRLYSWLTARKAFQIVGEIRQMDLMPHGLELSERFRLEPDLPVRKMSRGNRQKVALVLALVHRPKLLILDEPTSGLDPLMQDTLGDCLRELSNAGHTVFFSSHTLNEVETLCDRVAVVRDGRIVANERISEMKLKAPRSVSLRFETEQAARAAIIPGFLKVERQQLATLHLRLNGPATELTKWAASQALADITIGSPNLESLFRGFYDLSSLDNSSEQSESDSQAVGSTGKQP